MNAIVIAALIWVHPTGTVLLSEEVQGDCAPYHAGVDYVNKLDATMPVCWTRVGDDVLVSLPTGTVVKVPVDVFVSVEEK